jgi:hypothetical protein
MPASTHFSASVQRGHRVVDHDASGLQRRHELGRAAGRGGDEADAAVADEAQHRVVLQEADRQVHAEGQAGGPHLAPLWCWQAAVSPDEVSMMPRPPARDTALASGVRAIQPMGACTMG